MAMENGFVRLALCDHYTLIITMLHNGQLNLENATIEI